MRSYLQLAFLGFLGASVPLMYFSKGYFFASLVISLLLGLASLSFEGFKTGAKKVFCRSYFATFIPLLLVVGISVIYSVDFNYSVKKLIGLLIALLAGSLLALILTSVDKKRMEITLKVMFGLALFNMLLVCYDMFFASQEFIKSLHGEGDDMGPGRVRNVASQLAVISPLLFAYIYQIKNKHKLAWVFLAALFLIIVASGGRSALLSFIVGTAFMLLLMSWKLLKIKLKQLVLGACLVISLLFVGVAGYKKLDQLSGKNEFEGRMTLNSKDISAGRFAIWQFAFNESLKNPVFGVGVGGFRIIAEKTDVKLEARNHPHNFILEILVSTGFIGLLISLIILAFKFAEYIMLVYNGNKMAIFVSTSFVIFWFNSLTSLSILQTYWIAFFAVVVVIGGKLISIEKGAK